MWRCATNCTIHTVHIPGLCFALYSGSVSWATELQVKGSIPYVSTGIFHWLNPSDRTVIPGSTQLLSGGKGG